MCRNLEVDFHSFLTSTLFKVSGQIHAPGVLCQGLADFNEACAQAGALCVTAEVADGGVGSAVPRTTRQFSLYLGRNGKTKTEGQKSTDWAPV
jgi:hypothetical protein